MKNKKLLHVQLDLTRKLLDVVNSIEEYNALKKEEAELLSLLAYTDVRRCSK